MESRSSDSSFEHLDGLLARFGAEPAGSAARARLRDDLVRGYRPLVERIVSRYRHRGEPVDDLEQVGMIGLMNALERYDPSVGTPFLGFAVPTVVGEIRRHFRDKAWSMRVPRALKEIQPRLAQASEEIRVRTGRAPRVSELAEALAVDRETVIDALQAQDVYRADSLDEPVGGGEGANLGSLIGGIDAGLDAAEARETLRPALRRLTERERTILLLRFFDNRTQSEIAAHVGVSQMQISRILTSTLAKLRRFMDETPEVRRAAV